jgi:hypothetical protein
MKSNGQPNIGPVSHQTIQLTKGKHASPEDGACVVELASMLAGEPFTDHPISVCPVIAALLRSYNDRVDDSRRQILYPYAAKIVGTRGSAHLEHMRNKYLSACVPQRRRGPWGRLFGVTDSSVDTLAARAVDHLCRRDEDSDTLVLELVDRLLALDPRSSFGAPDVAVLVPTHTH